MTPQDPGSEHLLQRLKPVVPLERAHARSLQKLCWFWARPGGGYRLGTLLATAPGALQLTLHSAGAEVSS